ncbi:sugar ABC transporter ATP-binding protein [Candidatus Sumerlaeota bacterium]|nr:sugar ABC transporter ATP-binding protein [Candidatus Sumerlaeota bacterium]
MKNITKTFPGVMALDGVNFDLCSGEAHSLVGENGAGKSTLIKVLTGVYRQDEGEILLEDKRIQPLSPFESQRMGVSTVYQEINLVPELSVEENLFLGRQPMKLGRIDWKKIRRMAEKALSRLNLQIDPSMPLSSFSIATQQMIAIARSLDISARVLILDEPTSSLDHHEVERLFSIIRKLKSEGLGVIFISHFLDQIFEVSDRLTILRNGQLIETCEVSRISRLELVAKMTGKSIEDLKTAQPYSGKKGTNIGKREILKAERLGRKKDIAPFDLQLHEGEILGFAGLLGSGRTQAAELLFGLKQPDTGKIKREGVEVSIRSPQKAVQYGIGFLPEDRKTQGIFPDLSVRENIILAFQSKKGWWKPLSRKKQELITKNFIETLQIKTADMEKPVGQLSGGNQQKVILARWLASQPEIIILDEPTRGIDVGAKAEIESLIHNLCSEGLSIILISGELEEVERNSHRIMVFRDKVIVSELEGENLNLPNIMKLIAEGEANPRETIQA